MSVFAGAAWSDDVALEEAHPERTVVELSELFPIEAERMAKAVEKRRREFALGRQLARRGLARLGVAPVAIAMGADRAPEWPEGIVGSITHTKSWCAAAVARREVTRGLGLDVEMADDLATKLWDSICTPRDLAWLDARPANERGRLAKAIFSAKESAYKAQYAVTRTYLGFMAMSVTIDPDAGRFVATFEQPSGDAYRPGDVIEGRVLWAHDVVATAVVLPP
ncbi:MAG: 4'-phosphopantetheinyl transferase superfamily protein [Myxococcales bacterium]|nr:4'-phosphopantetheinyl transferase superfamily protein [Myxococcales bacterium]